MKKIKQLFLITLLIGSVSLFMSGCDDDPDDPDDSLLDVFLGWIGNDAEDLEAIENDVNFDDNTELPSLVDLSNKFPPIGNQGAYGTCVAWATGYAHRSYINAVEKGLSRTNMESSSNTFSAKYLFWSIPNSDKGSDCGGTGFESAYDVMLEKGIPTESTVPYTELGDCSESASAWDGSAADYKLQSYREIELSKSSIKKYLAQKRAISFGAKLGDSFMSWNSSSVLTDDTDTYNGQHAYHAMILCGYDDSKNAFRVVNSWGTSWGDGGYIWVDQDFFVGTFCFCAFVANSGTDRDGDDNDVDDPTSGYDLLAWELNDNDNADQTDATYREAVYNAFNSGTSDVLATQDWNILYLAVNSTDANDYKIILYDYYSDDYGDAGQNDEMTQTQIDEQDTPAEGYWWNYIDVPSGKSVAQAVYDDYSDPETRFNWRYQMPDISGEYFLVLIADGFNDITEADEDNNYFWLTASDGGSITISNGIIQDALQVNTKSNKLIPDAFDDSPSPTIRTKKNLNAYTVDEIRSLIKNRIESGAMKRKALEHIKNNNTGKKTRHKR